MNHQGWRQVLSDERFRLFLRETARLGPNLAKLLARLATDPRVSSRAKWFAAAAAAYVVLPIDLIPDFVPLVGKVDDLLIVSLALRHVIEEAGMSAVLEHWDGPDRVIMVIADVVTVVSDTVPRPLRLLVGRYLRAAS